MLNAFLPSYHIYKDCFSNVLLKIHVCIRLLPFLHFYFKTRPSSDFLPDWCHGLRDGNASWFLCEILLLNLVCASLQPLYQ